MFIPFNQTYAANAHLEQQMRAPFMITKFEDNDARKAGQLRGLMIEQHVSGWFVQNYERYYLNPDNHQQWKKSCAHDFKLYILNKSYLIDVAGPKKDGTFGTYPQKPHTNVDFHILCKPVGFLTWNSVDYSKGFDIIGVLEPKHFLLTVDPVQILDFYSWLASIGI